MLNCQISEKWSCLKATGTQLDSVHSFTSAVDQGDHARHQIVAVQGAAEELAAQGDPDVRVVGTAAEERLLPHQQHQLLQHREPSLKVTSFSVKQ